MPSAIRGRDGSLATPALVQPGAGREPWPDLARGVTVLLVVAMHLMYLHLVPHLWGTAATSLHQRAIDWTTPLRMPLFFVISGYLSARMLTRSWRSGFSGRIAPRVYLYVVWLAVTTISLWGLRGWSADWDPLGYFLPELLYPSGVLWYLWALPVYFAVARATRALPVWLVIALAAAASIGVEIAGDTAFLLELVDFAGWVSIVSGFLPFVVGARLPDAIRALARSGRAWQTARVVALAIAAVAVRRESPVPIVTELLVSAVCVGAALMVMSHVAHWRMWRPIRYIGRNTLTIFALHPLLIIALNKLFSDHPAIPAAIRDQHALAVLLPTAELLLIVGFSLLFERLLRRVGLRHLFEMPRFRAQRRRVRGRLEARQSERTNSSSISS
ncbi:acyltransferase family protein [Agrococcus sp. TSP3-2-1]|uniref:acyltransferase family protein n=1 Tax=Agrococcus sp. TSP3-2-1 TaxID=2804583 RepID=UPI003CE91BE6